MEGHPEPAALPERLRAAEQALAALREAGHAGDIAAAGAASADLTTQVTRLQAGLVGEMRTRGWSWTRIGHALGMSRQAAHERFRHVPTRQDTLTQPRGAQPDVPPPTPSEEQGAEPDPGAARPSPPAPRGRSRRRRGAGVTAAQAAEAFDGDPYTLEAGHEAGVWVVTESGTRIGTVRRAYGPRGARAAWEAHTEAGGRADDASHPNRYDAALAVVRTHREATQAAKRRKARNRALGET